MNLKAALCHALRATTLGLLVVASIQGTAAHAAPAPATIPIAGTALAPAGTLPAWVREASRYVHVAGHRATIDPAIRRHLSAQVVAFVTAAVQRFNAQPLAPTLTPTGRLQQSQRLLPATRCQYDPCTPDTGGSGVSISGSGVIISGPCSGQAVISAAGYWWGEKVYLSHCAVINLEVFYQQFLAGGQGAAYVVAASYLGSPIAALIADYIYNYLSWITNADMGCNYSGLYLDFPWVLPVMPIVERTC